MKKAILTFGLFSLALTSFTTMQFTGDTGDTGGGTTTTSRTGDTGGQDAGGNKKLDMTAAIKIDTDLNYTATSSQNLEFRKKSDI